MADATDRASAVTEAHAQAMRMMEARAQQAEEKASMLSVMYEQMKDERNAGVHRFCNWVAGQVTVVGFDNLFPLVEAWGYECGWHETADGKTAITKLLDEFKASSGVMVVPVPAAATTPLPLPHTSVAKVGGDKVNDGFNGATALYVGTRPEIDQPPNGKLCGTPHPGAHPFRREGQAKDPRYTRIGEAIGKTEIPRRVNRRGGRFKFPNVGFPVHRNFGRCDKCVEARKIARQRRVLTPNSLAPGQNRGTKPWVQYESVASFVHEAHAPPGVAAAIQEFNKRLREFWCTSGHLLWESRVRWRSPRPPLAVTKDLWKNVVLLVGHLHLLRVQYGDDRLIEFLCGAPHPAWPSVMTHPATTLKRMNRMHGETAVLAFLSSESHKLWPVYTPSRQVEGNIQPALWPLNATFTYVASRLLTIELLEMLKGIGIDEPKEVFFSMAEVAEKFVKNGCPRPRKPYPFVSMVVEDDIPGLEWSHGLDPPPTRNVRTVRTLRP
ncbi:hypothetical protein DYB28_007562 [Aphanomyces astaci]|uniref:Uncharacterized protein n=1 Tax=Aphanomyces astaci TaxID=112090 RepID=A0A9X8DUR9_APHAT|nr:hypothetical protein DYB28_007562 [Aphanomyces astaci]